MPRLCRCGQIVDDICVKCNPPKPHNKKTKDRGYGRGHKIASELYRTIKPLCERCVMVYGVVGALPSKEMHHIHPIRSRPELAMNEGNWLALCKQHHEELEYKIELGMETKRWSQQNYEKSMER
jgi:hypothetical protein